jgi:hypothetical protein
MTRKVTKHFQTGARSYRIDRLPDDATDEDKLADWLDQWERKYHTVEEVADLALRAVCDVYRREGLDPDASDADLRTLWSDSGKEEGGAAYWAGATARDALDLVEAKKTGDVDAVARCAWLAAKSHERLMAAAYSLKSLGVTIAHLEDRGRKNLVNTRRGSDAINAPKTADRRRRLMRAVELARRELELPLPAGRDKWDEQVLAEQVFQAWPDSKRRVTIPTIKRYITEALAAGDLTLPN